MHILCSEKLQQFEIEEGTNGDAEKSTAPTELKATLNLAHAVSLAVGQTIGSGNSARKVRLCFH